MLHSISTLGIRNLRDVFCENDPARRRAAIDEIFTEDCVFYDPKGGVYRGRDEIDRIAGAIKATHPDFRYQPIAGPEELGDGSRVRWVSGRPVRRQLMLVLISSSRGTAGLQPFSRLPHQHFADLHDRLNIGIVRRVPLELGGVWSKSGCEHLSGVEGGVHHSHEGSG